MNIGYDNEKGLAALKQAAELNSKRSHVGFILALYSRQMQNSKITKESLALEIVVNPGIMFTKELGESTLFPEIVNRALELYSEIKSIETNLLYLEEAALSEQLLRWYAGLSVDTEAMRNLNSPMRRQFAKLLFEGADEELLFDSRAKVTPPKMMLALIYPEHAHEILNLVLSESGYDQAQVKLLSDWIAEDKLFNVNSLRQDRLSEIPKTPYLKKYPGYSIYNYDLITKGPMDVFVFNKSMLHELLFARIYSRGEYIPQAMFSEKYKILIDELLESEEAH